ncbi:MAG TPA: TonB-dependent receptor [Parafilimonas sp.]|nr:TonB-dependent receptor [Parafilimonas sp.]
MKKILTTALAAVSIASFAEAQTDSTKFNLLDELVVTATKSPKKLSETGKVLTVITQQQLQRSSSHSIGEILNEQTGLIVGGSTANAGTNQTIYLRGASAGNTLILIDGVPMYDPSGISSEYDIGFLNINQIERIEILKGAQSTLYGSDAVAGVINIITKKASSKPFAGFADVSAGSYGTINSAAGINGTSGKFRYTVGSSYIHTEGFSSAHDSTEKQDFDKDSYSQSGLNASLGYKFSSRFDVRGSAQFNQYKAGIDAGAYTDDKDYNFKDKNTIARLTAAYNGENHHVIFNYQYSFISRSLLDDSTDVGGFATYQNGSYKSRSHFVELYDHAALSKHLEFLLGSDFRHYSTSQSYFLVSFFGPYETALGDSAKVDQESLYASFFIKELSGFNAEIGGRVNHHSIYGWNGTYSFNPSYNINKMWKVFANIASAYRTPSLYELYSEYGNKDLKPEVSETYELGIQLAKERLQSRIVYFKRDIRDVIAYYTDPQTYASQYINADRQKDNGIEAELSFAVLKSLNVTANYSYVDGEITTASPVTSKDTSFFNLYRRPHNVFNFDVRWNYSNVFSVSAHLHTASHYYEAMYGTGPQRIDGYYTLDLYAEYKPVEYLTVFTDARNITDQQYFELPGYNSKRFNIMAGVRLNF